MILSSTELTVGSPGWVLGCDPLNSNSTPWSRYPLHCDRQTTQCTLVRTIHFSMSIPGPLYDTVVYRTQGSKMHGTNVRKIPVRGGANGYKRCPASAVVCQLDRYLRFLQTPRPIYSNNDE